MFVVAAFVVAVAVAAGFRLWNGHDEHEPERLYLEDRTDWRGHAADLKILVTRAH